MASRRKRLEPLSMEELSDLLDNNPSRQGLEKILKFELGTGGGVPPRPVDINLAPPVGAPERPPDSQQAESGVSVPEVPAVAENKAPPGGVSPLPTGEAIGPPTGGISNLGAGGRRQISTGVIDEPPPGVAFEIALMVRREKLYPVGSVEDGLTSGEQLLWNEMIRAGEPEANGVDRILSGAGYRTMAQITGQDPKTIKRVRRSLVKKLCIEQAGANTFTESARWIVYGAESILRRWRDAGMTHVRRTRGVEFIAPAGGRYVTPPG